MTSKADNFFNRCIFSSTNAQGIPVLQENMDLWLQKLQEEADICNIFSLRGGTFNDWKPFFDCSIDWMAENDLP